MITRFASEVAESTISNFEKRNVELSKMHTMVDEGISSEIIDPVMLTPIDIDAIVESVNRTKRLIVVDNGWVCAGVASEIVSQVVEHIGSLELEIRRMGFVPTPCPTTKCLETLFYPNARTISKEAYKMVTGNDNWIPDSEEAKEVAEFRGPF